MPTGREVDAFVQEWFDLLGAHGPVERILPLVVDVGLVMELPDRTLYGHRDVREWYAGLGRDFRAQNYAVEQAAGSPHDSGTTVQVVVRWTATPAAGGPDITARVRQDWLLGRTAAGAPIILTYHVRTVTDISPEAPVRAAPLPGRGP